MSKKEIEARFLKWNEKIDGRLTPENLKELIQTDKEVAVLLLNIVKEEQKSFRNVTEDEDGSGGDSYDMYRNLRKILEKYLNDSAG